MEPPAPERAVPGCEPAERFVLLPGGSDEYAERQVPAPSPEGAALSAPERGVYWFDPDAPPSSALPPPS